jgi:hypothetical protein
LRPNYVLIDFESVQVKSLALIQGEHFHVHVFLGPTNPRLPRDVVLAMHSLGDKGHYVELDEAGPNALDFHIAYYLGKLVSADPTAFYHVISKDKGFDPLIRHLKTKGVFAARSESIEAMPCFNGRKSPTQPQKGDGDLDALVSLAIDDLIKRKAARPRKVSTLRSTVLARLGKSAGDRLDQVIAALVTNGHVIADGDKVTYRLPA